MDDSNPRAWHARQARHRALLAELNRLADTGEPIPRGWDLAEALGFSDADSVRSAIRRLCRRGELELAIAPNANHYSPRYVRRVRKEAA